MDEAAKRFQEVFLELFESLPRQGPGDRASTARALALCRGLPPAPAVLDLGCGVGAQTLHLAELTAGDVVAVDLHAPSVGRLARTVAARGLAGRVRPLVGDIARPAFAPASFDLVWSEGALYNVGIGRALAICRRLLRPGGCLAFTDAVWRREDPPPRVREMFADHVGMGWTRDVLGEIERGGFESLGHFTLPDEAWWDGFYGPMERRIEELRGAYADDPGSLAALDELAREPGTHRRCSAWYAYEFFVARRPGV